MEPGPDNPLIIASAINGPWKERYENDGAEMNDVWMTTRDLEPELGGGVPDGYRGLNHFHIQDN